MIKMFLIKVYIETGRSASTAATISIKTNTGTASRKWNIKVTKIDSWNPLRYKNPTLISQVSALDYQFHFFIRAPTDCFQYFPETAGRIKSFNFGSGLMTNLRYEICIREEIGKNKHNISIKIKN